MCVYIYIYIHLVITCLGIYETPPRQASAPWLAKTAWPDGFPSVIIRENWNDTENISMAPAQGWHAHIEKCKQFRCHVQNCLASLLLRTRKHLAVSVAFEASNEDPDLPYLAWWYLSLSLYIYIYMNISLSLYIYIYVYIYIYIYVYIYIHIHTYTCC